ncbi:MAG: dTMP kinase [Bacteroidales bacterium]|nr:dTMP kinase [Bacteroidales bacterium]
MRLFVIEGLDGSGKSTQIKLLGNHLEKSGFSYEYLHFPRTDAPWFGELIARFLRGEFGSLNEVDPYLVAMLYAGDRKDASELIRKWFDEGRVVLLDRYTYSNIAYQCAKFEDKEKQDELKEWILKLEFEHFGIPRPSVNIFLDMPLAFIQNNLSSERDGEDRKYLNGKADIHESSIKFQQRVRDMYLRVAGSDPYLEVINCSDTDGNILNPDRVFELILDLLNRKRLLE